MLTCPFLYLKSKKSGLQKGHFDMNFIPKLEVVKSSNIVTLPPNLRLFLKIIFVWKKTGFWPFISHASSESHFTVSVYFVIPVWVKEMLHFHLTGLEPKDGFSSLHSEEENRNTGKGIYLSLYLHNTAEAVKPWQCDLVTCRNIYGTILLCKISLLWDWMQTHLNLN